MSAFKIFGAVPSLVLSLIIISSVYEDKERPYLFAVLFGFLADLNYGLFFGFNMLLFIFAVFITKFFAKGSGEKTPFSIVISLFVFLFFIYSLFQGIFFILNGGVLSLILARNYLIQIVLNISVGTLIFFSLGRLFDLIKLLDKSSSQKIIR